jgi:hypothetical protein
MNFRKVPTVLLLLLLSSSVHGIAQAAAGVLPQDPTALMVLAHDKNGLVGSDIKPWHIRGTYRSFDAKGKPEYEGTYEEWWDSSTKYKLSFINPKSTQTDYATGTALLRDGSQEWQSGFELLLRASLIEPLPEVSQLSGFTLQRRTQAFGQSNFECVNFTYPVSPSLQVLGNFYPSPCFEPTMPMLRVYSDGSATRIVYDKIVSFQGHYLARQIQVFASGKLVADMDLDIVESLKESPDTLLAAPATALPVDLTKIVLKEGSKSRWPSLLRKAVPMYPSLAKSKRIDGTVNIRATIGVDGHIDSMQPVDGPMLLRQAAFDAVHQWIYRPFDLMGQPRPVEIEIHVVFTLG